jgi:hypothetical protein
MADPSKLRRVPTFNPRAASPRATAQAEPQMLTVKAAMATLPDGKGGTYESPVVVYDVMDTPIPGDRFVTVPLTADLVLAIKTGDLIEQTPSPGMTAAKLPAEFGGVQSAGTQSKPPEQQPPQQMTPQPAPAPRTSPWSAQQPAE